MQTPPDPNNLRNSRPPITETVGATSAPFTLGKGPTTISFEIGAPANPVLLRGIGRETRVLVRIENVRSTEQAPSFKVYLNVPPGEDPKKYPDLYGFIISTFGLVEFSRSKDQHPGKGLSFLKDVTELFARLSAARDWDHRTLRVSFVPGDWDDYPINVKVGRVSLIME